MTDLRKINTRELLIELAKRRDVGIVVRDAFRRGVMWWGINTSADQMAELVSERTRPIPEGEGTQ